MLGLILFMASSLFIYVIFLKYYNMARCPLCYSNKIVIEKQENYNLSTCQVCKFSFRDYFLFYSITPIHSQVDLVTLEYEEEEP